MVKLKLIEEIIRKDRGFNRVEITCEPVELQEPNPKVNHFDPVRIRLNFGTRSLYVFGKTENGIWIYFITVYEHSGEPAGPLFCAPPGLENEVICHIKKQLQAYLIGDKDV